MQRCSRLELEQQKMRMGLTTSFPAVFQYYLAKLWNNVDKKKLHKTTDLRKACENIVKSVPVHKNSN